MFYEPQQLSLFLWNRPDPMTEHDLLHRAASLHSDYEQLPPPDDDPLPRLLRAMQSEMWGNSRSAVFHDARRVDCTAEDERRERFEEKRWYQQVRHCRAQVDTVC